MHAMLKYKVVQKHQQQGYYSVKVLIYYLLQAFLFIRNLDHPLKTNNINL
jgi:hypothetical protein